MSSADAERQRRWRLALGVDDPETLQLLSERDQRLDAALALLYDSASGAKKGRGGLGRSAPRVARWLGDIREFFPTPVVQVIQRDALERLGLHQMLLEPELLSAMEADVHLVADLIALRAAIPETTRETARAVVQKVVDQLIERLARRMGDAVRGAVDRSRRTTRPRPCDIDLGRTIRKNLHTWQPQQRALIPERLVGNNHRRPRLSDLDEVILCVDQSGSMASSVVYASVFAAVLASLPVLRMRLVCFDTQILDLTEQLVDPVEVLFGVQLGGGTDIAQALGYVAERVTTPTRAHVVLISDLYEGGDPERCLELATGLLASGVQLIVLLALSDDGAPSYDTALAVRFAGLGCPVFACTPDQFPDLMATALSRGDVSAWAAGEGVVTVR